MNPREVAAALLPKLRSERVVYFPIRHHSPACAAHLHAWILTHKPAAVLVEGPASFTEKIDWLVDPQCVCPVAFFTTFIDKRKRSLPALPEGSEELPEGMIGPPRYGAFYPFCDYSPELVALRTGRKVGARLRFIDLEYAEMVLARHEDEPEREPGVLIDLLASDPHLKHSEYIQELARRMGCRGFDELWDHLFESTWDGLETDPFIDRVATWCAMARLDYDEATLVRDGTLAREACMAAEISDELQRVTAEKRTGPVLVVTGGFHTVALPDLVAAKAARPKSPGFTEGETGSWLMRYSFDRLDAISGYASGMPSPAFYDRLWRMSGPESHADPARRQLARVDVAAEILVEISRLTRERQMLQRITTPDAIAALQMTKQLAALRGHAWPLREDVLDGVRSCFVKGEMGAEGQVIMHLVNEVLAGNRVGQVPPAVGVPPIVHDFIREGRRLRLPVDHVESRELELDLYRNATHRQISRFCHRLELLNAPFAMFRMGPDFVLGQGLDRIREVWEVRWSPGTESALIEAAVYGPTVEEAAGGKLMEQIGQLDAQGQGRSTQTAVNLLVRAYRLGLHAQMMLLAQKIDEHIAEDPAFSSLVTGLSQLELIYRSREPLEAGDLTAVPYLAAAAYHRACRLLVDLPGCPDEMVGPVIGSLRTLREVLVSRFELPEGVPPFDVALFHQGLWAIVKAPPAQAQAAVVGAAAGILFGEGQLGQEPLLDIARGYLGGARTEAHKTCGILRGLLATAREAAWQVQELIRAIDAQLQSWDEETFLQVLPELRLAYADLTPREISRVAEQVAGELGVADLGNLVHVDLDETDVHFALELNRTVKSMLERDGLWHGTCSVRNGDASVQ